MATVVPLPIRRRDADPAPDAAPGRAKSRPGDREHRNLSFWMHRVLKELEKLRTAPDADVVHDLRVALRRCRSIAAVMAEVDSDARWPQLRHRARKLFRALGDWRDVQVQQEWVKKLAPQGGALAAKLSTALESAQDELEHAALKKASHFADHEWQELAHVLAKRVRVVRPGGSAAECLALERLEEAKELHRRALRTDRPKPWHQLRIGVKRFRYTTEAFLPQRYTEWEEELKSLQDALGDLHDLDVLRAFVKHQSEAETDDAATALDAAIEKQRTDRVEAYRRQTLGATSLWAKWRLGLPSNGKLEKAARARLRVTARACDPRPRKARETARVARALFRVAARAAHGDPHLARDAKRILDAAAVLQGVRGGMHSLKPKAGRRFLAALPPPAGWKPEEWSLVGTLLRYARGKEPRADQGKLAPLAAEERSRIFVLAGILRLARGLRRVGIVSGRGMRADGIDDAIVIHIPGLRDSAEDAVRLAAAKHLLESGLRKAIVLRSAPAENVVEISGSGETGPALAAASD